MKCNGGKISEAPSALRSARSLLSARSARPNKRENGRNRARKSRRRMRRDKKEAATVRANRPISIHFSCTVLLCKYSTASGHRKARLLRTTRLTFGGFGRRRERERERERESGEERAAQRVNCFAFTFKRPFQIANEGLSPPRSVDARGGCGGVGWQASTHSQRESGEGEGEKAWK